MQVGFFQEFRQILHIQVCCHIILPQFNTKTLIIFISKYSVSRSGDFSLRSNNSDDGLQSVFGSLMIGMNPDTTIKDAVLSITMQASSTKISEATNVWFSRIDDASDLLILVSLSTLTLSYVIQSRKRNQSRFPTTSTIPTSSDSTSPFSFLTVPLHIQLTS